MFRRLKNCHNVEDFRLLAKQRLPGRYSITSTVQPMMRLLIVAIPTHLRNAIWCLRCWRVLKMLICQLLLMGQRLAMPIFCSPTALQRLFHHDGERAVARAAEKFGTMFGVSALGTVTLAEIGNLISTPKMFQFYFHKDRGLNDAMVERAQAAGFNALALTVDTITGGKPGARSVYRLHFASPAHRQKPHKLRLASRLDAELPFLAKI